MPLLLTPGGKAKYTGFIVQALCSRYKGFAMYMEPFIGGGSVALEMAAKHPSVKLILNDLDEEISSFWSCVATAPDVEFQSLVERILNTHPTLVMFKDMRNSKPNDRVGRAFRTVFLTRTSFGGMRCNPRGGKRQELKEPKNKIDGMWKIASIIGELYEARRLLHGRTTVLHADFGEVIPLAQTSPAIMYLDPLYFVAGNRLFNFQWTNAAHIRLRDTLKGMTNWLLSYDDDPFIRELYKEHPFVHMPVRYTFANHRKVNELLIFPK